MKRIYLDYNATTPLHPAVIEEMKKYMEVHFGNPSSAHWFGMKAKEGVKAAREQVSSFIECFPEEIIFTSGGTESNNHVIRGVAELLKSKGNHIITSQIEHPAIIKPCRYLEKKGFEISYLPVDKYGKVDPDDVKKSIKESTILITIMHANNEVGTIQPIQEIAKIAKENNVLFHTDAAQSIGKMKIDINELGVDFLTIAGHKLYAPKGVGALFIKKDTILEPFILGAGHENGKRAGTENVIGIAGLGKACEILKKNLLLNSNRIKKLRNLFYDKLKSIGIEIMLNGHPEDRLPNTLNVSFNKIDSHELLQKIPELAASTGSACHANSKEPSAVLTAMGIAKETAFSAVRFSLGMWTTDEEINYIVEAIKKVSGAWNRFLQRD